MSFFKDFKADFTQAMNELMPDGNEVYDDDVMEEPEDTPTPPKKKENKKLKPSKAAKKKEKKIDDLDLAPEDMSDQIDDLLENELYGDASSALDMIQDDVDVNTMDMSVEELLQQLEAGNSISEDASVEAVEIPEAGEPMEAEVIYNNTTSNDEGEIAYDVTDIETIHDTVAADVDTETEHDTVVADTEAVYNIPAQETEPVYDVPAQEVSPEPIYDVSTKDMEEPEIIPEATETDYDNNRNTEDDNLDASIREMLDQLDANQQTGLTEDSEDSMELEEVLVEEEGISQESELDEVPETVESSVPEASDDVSDAEEVPEETVPEQTDEMIAEPSHEITDSDESEEMTPEQIEESVLEDSNEVSGIDGVSEETEPETAVETIPDEEIVDEELSDDEEIEVEFYEEPQDTVNSIVNVEEDNMEDKDVISIKSVDEKTVNAAEEIKYNVDEASSDTTYVTKGTKISGNIETDASIDIIGIVEGDVNCKGKVVVGGAVKGAITAGELYCNSARIDGNIKSYGSVKVGVGSMIIGNVEGESAVIAGAVNGDIDVKGPVIVDSTAVIMGNIKSRSVQINNGAVIEGFCSQSYSDIDVKSFFA